MEERRRVRIPEMGSVIPVSKIHVSRLNVRAEEAFGEEEDKALIQQLRKGEIVQPFKARPEEGGFGVYVGRRRFLAKKYLGAKEFIVGKDFLIEDLSEEKARRQSLIENLQILRKKMNPIARARQLNEIVTASPSGLRGIAIQMGVPTSTLCEYLKVLDLSLKMQEALKKGLLYYTDSLLLARLNLGRTQEDKLAEILEQQGYDAFKREVTCMSAGKKRGLPRDVYIVLRATFDKRYPPDLELYRHLETLARNKNLKIDEYAKEVLSKHVETMGREVD